MESPTAKDVVPGPDEVVTTTPDLSLLAPRATESRVEGKVPAKEAAASRSEAFVDSPIARKTSKALAAAMALAPREADTLNLLARGHSYAQTAALLGVSISTIQTYVKKIYRKLGVSSRSAAVLEAYRRGLLAADLFVKRR